MAAVEIATKSHVKIHPWQSAKVIGEKPNEQGMVSPILDIYQSGNREMSDSSKQSC